MDSARIDHWLKLVCLFKHRSDAAEACRGGHVKINGERAKPAAKVRIGDCVELTGEPYRKVVVESIPERSISKDVARTMYRDETPQRPALAKIPGAGRREAGSGRPTKKERREIDRWRR